MPITHVTAIVDRYFEASLMVGELDDVGTDLLAFMDEKYPEVGETIRTTGALSDVMQASLTKGMEEFKAGFTA